MLFDQIFYLQSFDILQIPSQNPDYRRDEINISLFFNLTLGEVQYLLQVIDNPPRAYQMLWLSRGGVSKSPEVSIMKPFLTHFYYRQLADRCNYRSNADISRQFSKNERDITISKFSDFEILPHIHDVQKFS